MTTSIENKPAKVFVDTNVIVDAFSLRDTNYKPSQQVLRYIAIGKIEAYICSKQITDLNYIFRKYHSNKEETRKSLKTITQLFEIKPLLKGDILACLNAEMKDFEDAVLDEVAKVNMIPYFITNNIDDFKNSKSMVLTPEQFLTLFQLNK